MPSERSRRPVRFNPSIYLSLDLKTHTNSFCYTPDAKAKKDMAEAAKGKKGPLNTGSQGIKKSGKK